jgi:hypothetical protein
MVDDVAAETDNGNASTPLTLTNIRKQAKNTCQIFLSINLHP